MGVGSTLKSPVWMITPSGVWMASATQSTRLCVTCNGMDREGPDLDALAGLDLVQFGVVEQAMLVQFVFHVSQGEFSAVDRNIQFGREPRAARRCGLRGRG